MVLNRGLTGLLLGPALFLAVLLLPLPEDLAPAGLHVAAVAVLMATWWASEAIPLPATALVPIVLYPLLGVMDGSEVTRAYANHLIYLFMGGFLIAVTMEKWNLHHRIALHTIRLVGLTEGRLVLGFMLATAFLSMWLSNTAATMMMVTIGIAVLREVVGPWPGVKATGSHRPGVRNLGSVLMLGIGYAASIGGVATLVGTPPNAILAGVIEKNYGYTLGFLEWMKFALPLSLLMLLATWLYLIQIVFKGRSGALYIDSQTLHEQIARLGPVTREEKWVMVVFVLVATLWILRGLPGPGALLMVKDSTIAIGGALLLFVIPVNLRKKEFLLDWKTAVTIPWDIIVLFGGGFALAQGFSDSGLTIWLAQQLTVLQGVAVVMVIGAVVLLVIFLTEITSNTATASLLMPVMGALATAIGVHPLGLMTAAVVAASFAFMLPVATPPNAIVYGSRYVTIQEMIRAGFWLNLLGIVLITGFVYLVLPSVWGVNVETVSR